MHASPSTISYEESCSVENLLDVWNAFRKGKRNRPDVMRFEMHLERNLFKLSRDLLNDTYTHGAYHTFTIHDPKKRRISKASVRDRVVHHLVFGRLYEIYEAHMSIAVYSGRKGRGTHSGVKKIFRTIRKVSRNYTKPCWGLKIDIERFYDNIDHKILKDLIAEKVRCARLLKIVYAIIDSFRCSDNPAKRIPLGNLTSQIFNNIYLAPIDRWIMLQNFEPISIRYCDDLIFVSTDLQELLALLEGIKYVLYTQLSLSVHPRKIILSNVYKGLDVLGYVLLPHAIVLRTSTKRRMFMRLEVDALRKIASYYGLLSHAKSYLLLIDIQNRILTGHEQKM